MLIPPSLVSAKGRRRGPKRPRHPRLTLKVLDTLAIAQRTEKPTFTSSSLRLMNRGKCAYYGKGMWVEQQTFYLLRLADGKHFHVTAPFAAYVKKNPGMRADPTDHRPLHKQFQVTKLLYYDEENGEAGFEVADQGRHGGIRRHFLMQWDLRKGRIAQATLVARSQRGRTYTHMLPLGYDSKRREFSYVRQVIDHKSGGRTIFVIGFSSHKPRVIAQFEGRRSMSSKTYFDDRRQRALLVEYAELASKGPAPRGHLVDMVSGKTQHFPIPLTTYGVAMGPEGRRIYAYSAQLGDLWTIDAATGKQVASIKLGKLGHELRRVASKKLLLLRNSGFRFLRLTSKGLSRGRWVPIKRLYSGFSHVEGSLVTPGRALVRNGDTVYVVAFQP